MTTLDAAAGGGAPDIDEFRLVRVLGQGGMGTVYLGHDTILDRPVAIKLVRVDTTVASRQRFLTEARAIARLDHPNVISIFRAGTTRDGAPYLVQELVRGQTLDRLSRPVAPRRGLELAIGIARGLAAAHRRGVLHRDVKPSNVMLDETGRPRLLDFGLAKLTADAPAVDVARVNWRPARSAATDVAATADGPSEAGLALLATAIVEAAEPRGATAMTHGGAILGTPRYMAPELWRGEAATVRSDLYAWGVVLYELLTGQAPFPQTDHEALAVAVLRGPPPEALIGRVDGLDASFAELVLACLARDPERRPESADELVARLENLAAGGPPVPEGNPYRGLLPFEAEQRGLFFGRGQDVSAVIERLRADALVVVAGDSGVGKSSLCRAGVLPAIAAGALGDERAWTSRTVTLGRRPLGALAEGLGLGPLPDWGDGEPVATALARARAARAAPDVVLLVDQAEELVTQCPPADAARAAAVLAALGEGLPGVKVLVAVRGDFLTRVAALPGLRGVMTRSLHLVRGLALDDARESIVAPALAKGVRFASEAMVAALAASIVDRPAALPLLQFTLAELWARRDVEAAVIPEHALDEIGGVAGALARCADRVLTGLAAPERLAARRILVSLVTPEGTRAARVRTELLTAGDEAASAAALEALVQGRLVVARDVADGAPLYELAHESLLLAWATLRDWLDEAAGQRGVRARLAAAASEWRRLGRRRDLLWRRSQWAGSADLDGLTADERAFLAASRRATRWRTLLVASAIAAVPAAALATWWGVAHGETLRRERTVAVHLAAAAARLDAAQATVAAAEQVRGEALALFAAASTDATVAQGSVAERAALRGARRRALDDREGRWAAAAAAFDRARATLGEATRELEAALQIGARRGDVRRAMAGALYAQALLAERVRDAPAVRELEQRLATYDDGAFLARWHAPAPIVVRAIGAEHIALAAYHPRPPGGLVLAPTGHDVAGDRLEASLPPGSYRATITAAGIDPVHLPFVVERGRGEAFDVVLPRPGDVPLGFVYVPAGRFLCGADDRREADLAWLRRNFLRAPPLHTETTDGYLIARHEVTFGDWMTFLGALPPEERERRRPRGSMSEQKSVRLDGGIDGPFVLSLRPLDEVLVAAEGEPLIYPGHVARPRPRWEATPVGGVDRNDAEAYAAWLSASGRVSGARLCTPPEWERAARGADGRRFPHGDDMHPGDFNIDETYDREAVGPDEVGAHPASASPFGVLDMSGNAFELVARGAETSIRGGSWWGGPTSAATMNATPIQPTRRDAYIGIRLCADAPARVTRPR